MRKKSTKQHSAADFLASPLPDPCPSRSPSEIPLQFDFNLDAFYTTTSTSMQNVKGKKRAASASVLMQPAGSSPPLKTPSTISDLREMATSRLDSIKRRLERSQSEIVKDVESSQSRLNKRFKIQTQACQLLMEEADKEYKKVSARITESREAMKASYTEFIAEAQASASRVCKTSIPDLAQSFEKSIDALRSRYGIPSTPA